MTCAVEVLNLEVIKSTRTNCLSLFSCLHRWWCWLHRNKLFKNNYYSNKPTSPTMHWYCSHRWFDLWSWRNYSNCTQFNWWGHVYPFVCCGDNCRWWGYVLCAYGTHNYVIMMCTYSNVARELWKFTVVVECLCRGFFLSRNISLMQKKILSFLILLLLTIPIQNLIASTWAHAIRAKTYYKKTYGAYLQCVLEESITGFVYCCLLVQ